MSTYLYEWYTFHVRIPPFHPSVLGPLALTDATDQYVPTYEELYRGALPTGQLGRRDAWNVKLLAVNPDYQRRGVGRALLGSICRQVCTVLSFMATVVLTVPVLPASG